MKKIVIAITAFALVFGMAGCDKTDNQQPDQTPVETEDQTPTDQVTTNPEDQDVADTDEDTDDQTTEEDDASTDPGSDDKDTKLNEEDATQAYKDMVVRFESESPVDTYDDVMALLPRMPKNIASIMFAKFDKYMENWSMSYSDQMYFEDGPMSKMDVSVGQAYDYETDSYDLSKVQNETHKAIMSSLFENGFKFVWLEGSPYPIVDYAQFKSLGDKVPEEIMAFILVSATETNSITAADAGLVISWNELAKRAVNTESAMKIVKNEELYSKLEGMYRFYCNSYLLGMNNTPIVDWENNKVLPEVIDSYDTTMTSYPQTEVAKIVKKYMESLKTLDYTLPYSDQDKFQSVVKLQSDWIDEAARSIHAQHGH